MKVLVFLKEKVNDGIAFVRGVRAIIASEEREREAQSEQYGTPPKR